MNGPAATTARLDGIAETAALMFLDKGFDATSMSDVAAANGLGKSSLYHHLSGKEELLARICDRPLAELREGLEAAVSADAPAGERVAQAVDHATRTALAHLAATNLIVTLKPTNETARRVLAERREQERMLAELVAEGQAEGAARPGDPLLLTRVALGTINGLVAWYRPESSEVAPDEVRETVVAMVRAALGLAGAWTGR